MYRAGKVFGRFLSRKAQLYQVLYQENVDQFSIFS